MSPDSSRPAAKRSLSDRLQKAKRRQPGDPPLQLVQTPVSGRLERNDEVVLAVVGALMLRTLGENAIPRISHRAADALIERLTAAMTPREVMLLEIEAYEILDALAGTEHPTDEECEQVARREGSVIWYDPHAPILDLLNRAVEEQFDVKIDYFSKARGEMNTRRVTPISIQAETWLLGWCHARRAQRSFRISRITRCAPANGRPVEPPRQIPGETEGDTEPVQISLLDGE